MKLLLYHWWVLFSTGSLQKCRQAPTLLSIRKSNWWLARTAKASVQYRLEFRIHSNRKGGHRPGTYRWVSKELEMHLRKCNLPDRQHSLCTLHQNVCRRLKQGETRRQNLVSNIPCCTGDLRLCKYFQSETWTATQNPNMCSETSISPNLYFSDVYYQMASKNYFRSLKAHRHLHADKNTVEGLIV